jgi:cobalamin transport system ATP-binding protein
MSAEAPALQVENLSVRYGSREAVQGVHLSARPGELLALTGPNGSGKTSLLQAVLGITPAASGRVRVFGEEVRQLSPRERARRLAWVPQEEAPRDDVPLEDYVLMGRYARLLPFAGETRHDRAVAERALRDADLWSRRHDGIFSLSGGERQRVLLARALAQETPVLLMDEPTAHLDIGHQLDLFDRTRRLLQERGTCVIAAMHDLNLAARFADRIAVLSRGQLVAEGDAGRVLSPALLRRVWGIDAERRTDRRTGRPFLLPHLAVPSPAGVDPSSGYGPVHVIGGGGAASGILHQLYDAGFTLTAGVLHLLDSDAEAAASLGIPFAAEVPFSPIGEESRAQLQALLAAARAIVVAPFWIGPSNLANLEELRPHTRTKPVFLIDPDGAPSRDSSGGAATEVTHALLAEGARAVPDEETLFRELRALAGGAARTSASI